MMYFTATSFALATLVSTVHSHAAILAAVGDSGESQGFLVDPAIARNCTTISPCQQDATIIRDSEITQNIVNACGRTEIAGNIDIGEQTENELAAGRMAQVSSGSMLAVTIHQVNADGAGPFECDMDETSNAVTTFTPLKVSNNIPGSFGLSQAKEKDFVINVQMPDNFNCLGASTGNICTVRCRNNAIAGPFGGCFAVQQTDGTGRTNESASAVDTAQTLEGISAQILQNKKDLPAAIAANQAAGAAGGNEGASAISALVPDATQAPNAGNGNNNGGNNGGNQGGNGGKGNQNGNQGQGQGQNQNQGQGQQNQGAAQNGQGQGQGQGQGNGRGNQGQNQGQGGQGQGNRGGNRIKRALKFLS
ncbi:hypothetical protein CUC08_Gglean000966 [Alternaria sp. MG1]|uniref:Gas1-like protein n=3 Tax=Alternaria alternata complex TaxID=187734 RepID=A0A4Q4NQJ9_ALTAL|nr:uncharacterized protein J4E82_008614 [Alternaria postmessia]OWY46160.1 gas1-like protein [Alternaria alternata]RII21798.1 hypothetical protein CUC08_Gglean000966 [Alternaria sp. MG1]RYN34481.1 hypothetical protein AA0115_g2786 [Alternaria tenuissima]KAI5372723.1 hypothetical protein J4E82_008614 [Alternaria postmessia]RYN81211.1 hypothetical protein AA0117_g2666 [Alternaria alternata]